MESCVARGLRASKNLQIKNSPFVLLRSKSTVAQPKPAAKVQATPSPTTSQAFLSWPEYLAIRRGKRRVQTVRKPNLHTQCALNLLS